MEKKLSNAENISNLKKRKILRYIIIFFSLATIVTSLLTLIFGVSVIFALISFVITTILMKVKDNIKINKRDDLEDVRKVLNKSKK